MAATLLMLIIGLPWLGALIVWWIGDSRPGWQHGVAAGFSLSSGVAAVAMLFLRGENPQFSFAMPSVFGDFSFASDGLGIFLAVIATVIGSLAVIFSINYMRGAAQLGRYYALVLFFIGAMAGLVLATNLLLIFVFWEITALCSYALISFYNDDPKAVAGGMKALIITQLGGVGLLLGAVLSFAYLHTFDLTVFLSKSGDLAPNIRTILAFGFLIAAAAKSAQFPFQTWLPDAMEAPTPISALIHAATMVNAGVYLLARFYPAFKDVLYWREAVMFTGMFSALMAALMALVATDLKRVLAYSTVSQLGYMVYAVGTGGIFASQFHLLSHSVFKALLFLSAGAVIHSIGTRDMRLMGDLGRRMPVVRNVFILGSAALAGLPVLNGFWSKELILESGLHSGPGWMYGVMLFCAGLTALYTFRCVSMVFFGPAKEHEHLHDAGKAMQAALYPLAIGTLTTWLLAGPFSTLLGKSLPFHEIELQSTGEVLLEVIEAPATWIALAVVAVGIAFWMLRKWLSIFSEIFHDVGVFAQNSFGFELINRTIVKAVQSTGEDIRGLQTGLLNWNVLAILGALIIVLLLVSLGA
ncbi:MAG: NADH-quinone oxidoreductase subunit L [Anaerolineaceae bacterium]|nr:NADH-quinone oxidoreductase subunit L [Anaerolineaceae bacterium]